MKDYYENAQARIISNLNEHVKALENIIEEKDKKILALSTPAYYYNTLQKIVLENPVLQDDWTKFLTLIKLACEKEEIYELNVAVHFM
jgi:hypothetical protein